MERINQRTNHLAGTNIKKLRIEQNLRNKEIVAQLPLRGVAISTGTYSEIEELIMCLKAQTHKFVSGQIWGKSE